MPDIFISYARSDVRFARELYRQLSRFNVRGFMDATDISAGAELSRRLRDSIANAAAVVVILSREAIRSNWVMAELGMAESLGKLVIPVLAPGEVYDQAVPPQLIDRLVLDAGRTSIEETAARVVAAATNTSVDAALNQVLSRARRRQWILGVLATVFAVLSVSTFYLRNEAIRQRDIAEESRLAAEQAQERVLRITRGDASFALSPDGQVIATAADDGTVRLWDRRTGSVVSVLRGFEGGVSSLAFSPSGRMLATAGSDGDILLWDVGTGRQVHRLSGHTGAVQAMTFAPEGTVLLSRSLDGTLRQWDVESGRPLTVLKVPQ